MLIAQEICKKYTDRELIYRSLENIDFFSCIYERYEHRLFRYITRISKVTEEEAEDILQESFIKVWKNLHAIDRDLKLSSWLYRIVHNEVISRWRKTKSNQPHLELNENQLQVMVEDLEIKSTSDAVLNHNLEKIPEKYREILILKYFEGMSYEEISDILKIPEGTVAIRLNRAKKSIKTMMGSITK